MKHKYDVQNKNWIENMKRIIYENVAEKNWIKIIQPPKPEGVYHVVLK